MKCFWMNCAQLCDENGLLLILDEIQVGLGRTGTLFAYEIFDWEPDIIAIAKGLGGGFPVGACLANQKAAQAMKIGMHGSTFGGNPMAMALAKSVLSIISDPDFLAHIRRIGLSLTQRLSVLGAMFPDVVQDWRGRGLIYGFSCPKGAKLFVEKAREEKLLLTIARDETVRLLPPLNITETHLDEAFKKMEACCASLSQKPQGALVDALNREPDKMTYA